MLNVWNNITHIYSIIESIWIILVFQIKYCIIKYFINIVNVFRKKNIIQSIYFNFLLKLLRPDIHVIFSARMLSFCLLHEVNGILINDHLSNLSVL